MVSALGHWTHLLKLRELCLIVAHDLLLEPLLQWLLVRHFNQDAGIWIPRERAKRWCVQKGDDVRAVVGDGIDVVDAMVCRVVHVLLALVASHEAPSTVVWTISGFPDHVAHRTTVDGDHVGRDAATSAFCQGLDLICAESELLHIFWA